MRIEDKFLVKETECPASWQLSQVESSFIVSCRICDVILQAGGTPKCLLKKTKDVEEVDDRWKVSIEYLNNKFNKPKHKEDVIASNCMD